MEIYDLIIIGGGPGGYEAAIEAAERYDRKVALVENRQLGGTCLNRGCIPTKTLLHSANLLHELHAHGEEIGLLNTSECDYDMAKLQARKNAVVEQLQGGVASLMKKNKVTVFEGTGSILDKEIVRVTATDGSVEDLSAKNILIATGSVPSLPPIPGADLEGVITSDELLDLDQSIKSIVIIGGGVIGMEFASVLGALGVQVTVVEALDRILANLDKEIGQNLKMLMKRSYGVDIHAKSTVTEIKKGEHGLICCYTEKDAPAEVEADCILLAIGRRANTEGLILPESAEDVKALAMDRGKILVNDQFETSVPGIYAIGDVIGGIQLAHVATAEGRSAVAAMAGTASNIDLGTVPSCIYTNPEIASVGISADQAKAEGLDVIAKKYPMSANGKTVLELQDRGFIKVIADKETHQVLGAQMMCARATDMIAQFSQAIVNKLTLEDMSRIIYPHPTFSEGIGETVR